MKSRCSLRGWVGAAALIGAAAAQAGGVTVYVGYADNLRPSGFFPTTWLGDSNVVSESSAAQSFDSGAVRIDNNTGAAITISNFSVHFANGNVNYSIWNSLTIGAGQTGIFTQTFSYNFDTSENGALGAFPPTSLAPANGSEIGGCSSSAAKIAAASAADNVDYAAVCATSAAVISFMQDGIGETFTDTGHILDTGGWDFVNNGVYGGDGNESINWNIVGSTPDRSGNGVPEPATLALVAMAMLAAGATRRQRIVV